MDTQRIAYNAARWIRKNSSTLLTIASSVGTIVSVGLAIKETPKVIDKLEAAKKIKGSELTIKEKAKIAAPHYIPLAAACASTITCNVSNLVITQSKQKALTGAYILADNTYKQYRNKVKEIYGEEADEKICDSIAQDQYTKCIFDVHPEKMLFYDEFSKRFFYKTLADVQWAEHHLNRNFWIRGWAPLNEYYDLLEIAKIPEGNDLNWDLVIGDAYYGYSSIDFVYSLKELEDGTKYYEIGMVWYPSLGEEENEDLYS